MKSGDEHSYRGGITPKNEVKQLLLTHKQYICGRLFTGSPVVNEPLILLSAALASPK